MSRRAELRREMKSKEKAEKHRYPLNNPANLSADQFAHMIGVDVVKLKAWTQEREKEMREAAIEEFDQKLRTMETNATIANLIISMYAIKMTWGFTKSQQRFLENLRPAEAYIQRVGIKAAFDQIMGDCGTDIGFDDFDVLKSADDVIREIYGD